MTTWYVYKFTKLTDRVSDPKSIVFELLGTVEADHQPAAWLLASARWPTLAKPKWPRYQSGRLVVRTKEIAS